MGWMVVGRTLCSNPHFSLHSLAASAKVSFHVRAVALCCERYVFVVLSTVSRKAVSDVYSVDGDCGLDCGRDRVGVERTRRRKMRSENMMGISRNAG